MVGRKALQIILSISLLITLSGCKSKESISVANIKETSKNGYTVMISITTDSSNEVYNINRLDQFIENFNNSKKDKVTIIKYVKNENKIMTHIFEELEYDG